MRGSKALKLLIYCLWSIFVIRVHARWSAMVLSRAAEHGLCREVAGNLFLPPPGAVLPGCSGQGWGELATPLGPEPGWKCLFPVTHSKPGFPFRYSCLALAEGAEELCLGAELCPWIGRVRERRFRAQDVSSGRAGTGVVLMQSWAELIIDKSHQWIHLAFSSMRLGWGSHTSRNFATSLERIKPGATS